MTAQRTKQVWTADELMAIEFPPMRWAVEGVLAEGVNVFAAAPKFGKSAMGMGLAVAVALGGKAFGSIPVEQGDALYLALEDTGRRLQDRLRKLLRDEPAPPRLTLSTRWDGIEAVDKWLTEHPDARLVVVDVLAKVRGPMLRGEPSYTADYRALEPFADLARRHRVCVLVLHHTRKASGDDWIDDVSGTLGLAGSADAVLVARRSRNTGAAIVKLTGRDVEESELALQFDPHTFTWTLLDGPAEWHDVAETRAAILSLLEATPDLTPKEVAEKLTIRHDNAKKTLQRMANDGQVIPVGGGAYRVPGSTQSPQSPESPGDSGDTRDTLSGDET